MATIRIKVDGHLAQCVSVEPMATGSAGVDSVIIDRIDGGWDGFGLTAVFKTQAGSVYYAAVENGGAQIPAAALLSERFGLSLLGTKSDGQGGELRMTTNYVSFGIYAGAGSGGTYPDDPTETLYTEIREIAESAEAKAQSVVDRADAGEFTGPQGIQGPPGEVTEAELTEALAGKADVITDFAKGQSVTVTDASGMAVKNIRLYGQSGQANEPAPDDPEAPTSIQDPSVTITDGVHSNGRTVTALLRGLKTPFETYSDYKDGEGQPWAADVLDAAARTITKRIGSVVFDGTEEWAYDSAKKAFYTTIDSIAPASDIVPLSSHFIADTTLTDTTGTYLVARYKTNPGAAYSETRVPQGHIIELTADEEYNGAAFSCWKNEAGVTVCFDRTIVIDAYSHITLAPYYQGQQTKTTLIIFYDPFVRFSDNKIAFAGEVEFGDDFGSEAEHGILMLKSETEPAELDFDTPNVVVGKSSGYSDITHTYIVNKSKLSAGDKYYGRAYLKYYDTNGDLQTYLSEIKGARYPMEDGSFKILHDGSIYFRHDASESLADWQAWLGQNNVTVLYAKAAPAAEALPQADADALEALRTYKGTATIGSDAFCETEYRADTKLWIVRKLLEAAQNG